jgi:hypothetical protein
MRIIKAPLLFRGTGSDKYLYSLFDSGANFSAIRKDLAEQIDMLIPLPNPIRLATANNNSFKEIHHKFVCEFFLNDVRLSDEFLVIEDLSEEVIIGAAIPIRIGTKVENEIRF